MVLLFGPYTIHLHGEKNGEIYCIECQIYTWQDILGYRYIRKKNHVQHVLLFSEKKIVSILREKKSEESKPFNLQNRERTEKRKRITYFIDLFQIMGDTIVRLIRYLFHLIHFEKLRIIGIFGFKNPATTGMIYGWSQSLYYLKNKY